MTRATPENIAEAKGPYSRLAVEWSAIVYDCVKASKAPDAVPEDVWAPIKAMLAPDFMRTGHCREKVGWKDYLPLLFNWGKYTGWEYSIKSVAENDKYALIEMEERATYPDRYDVYYSVQIWEFDDNDKVRELRIYLSKLETIDHARSHQWILDEVDANFQTESLMTPR